MVKRAACGKEEEDPVPTPVQSTFRSVSVMGTQFEYAINLLAASPGSEALSFCGLDERGYLCNGKQKDSEGSSSSASILKPMGEPVDENSQEYIRRKMQMQEEVFRKQVRELHRLYSIQKMIMGELKKETDQSRFLSTTKRHQADCINWPTGYPFHLELLNDERGSQEQTAISGEAMRIPRGLDMEIRTSRGDNSVIDRRELPCPRSVTPATRDALHMDEGLDGESDVELTLSIGGRSSKRKSNSYSHRQRELESGSSKKKNSSASIMSDHGDVSNSSRSNRGGSSTTSDQRKKCSHWLFQA